jgi:hypothetical protein
MGHRATTLHAGCEMGCNQTDTLAMLGWPRMTLQHGSSCARRVRTPQVIWLGLVALLCVSNAVLAHDIYGTLRDRDGRLCCTGQDCKPVEATVLPNGSYYLPLTDETIPAEMATPSPDNRFHHCTYYPVLKFDPWGHPVWESKEKTRCFFAPMNTW